MFLEEYLVHSAQTLCTWAIFQRLAKHKLAGRQIRSGAAGTHMGIIGSDFFHYTIALVTWGLEQFLYSDSKPRGDLQKHTWL